MSPDQSRDARQPVDPDVEVAPRPLPHPWHLVRSNLDLLPVIAVGGSLGSLARWALGEAMPHASAQFAWSTFVINASGSLALGLLMALVLDVWSHHRYTRPFFGVGVLGGYTTFSTYLLDTRGVFAAGRPGVAFAYLLGTTAAGVVAVWVGLVLGRSLVGAVFDREDAEVAQ